MFFVFLCASFVSCMYEREKEEGRARVVLLVEKMRKEEKIVSFFVCFFHSFILEET